MSGPVLSNADSKIPSGKPSLLAFATDHADIETLKAFAAARQWSDASIQQGDIRTAIPFLKSNPSPAFLLVELPSASEAPALLDALAEVCDPDTKVITIGTVNEYSFYCWLMDLGIFSYLLRPLTVHALETAWQKSLAPAGSAKVEKQPGKTIAVIGARGGVGATTIAINLAAVIADLSKKQTALVDIDPQGGSIALALDIEPSRGLREALEKPDRIDSLFIERVMSKPLKNLSVLSAEESLQDQLHAHDRAAESLISELRNTFDIVLLDIPRHPSAFSRQCLRQAEHVVLVAEPTLLSLRDALRLSDLMAESFKMKPPVIVVNRVGLAPREEMPIADFEKGLNAKVACRVPFAPQLFMQVSNDIPVLKHGQQEAMKSLYALAGQLVPEAKAKKVIETKKGFNLGVLKHLKKEG
ncbi:MAG: AAA family ATPase [Pseudomonadota bacterium]|nr:AAA family ATPase [Pseudomonadota bacterium]